VHILKRYQNLPSPCVTVSVAAAIAGALVPANAIAASVSTNWAGYVASSSKGEASFSSVSGAWVAPSATCSSGRATDSAIWVGLGGYLEKAKSLEQIGTSADCDASGHPTYAIWLEFFPAAPETVKLKVRPGDTVVASVTVHAQAVTMRIRDPTRETRFSTTQRRSNVDSSTADWIVEAPSACLNSTLCEPLPLTNLGSVAFSNATAIRTGHTGPAGDPTWSTTALEVQQESLDTFAGTAAAGGIPTATMVSATPSAVSTQTGAFSVAWAERAIQIERPAPPTLPGFNGADRE
jgi:hypothetical protein